MKTYQKGEQEFCGGWSALKLHKIIPVLVAGKDACLLGATHLGQLKSTGKRVKQIYESRHKIRGKLSNFTSKTPTLPKFDLSINKEQVQKLLITTKNVASDLGGVVLSKLANHSSDSLLDVNLGVTASPNMQRRSWSMNNRGVHAAVSYSAQATNIDNSGTVTVLRFKNLSVRGKNVKNSGLIRGNENVSVEGSKKLETTKESKIKGEKC